MSRRPKFYTADGHLFTVGMSVYVPGPWASHRETVKAIDRHGPLSDYPGSVFPLGRIVPAWAFGSPDAAGRAAALVEHLATARPEACACPLCWVASGRPLPSAQGAQA